MGWNAGALASTLDAGTEPNTLLVAGTYRLSAQLSSGGMGDIYHGEHVRLGSPVAVKLLRSTPDGVRSRERFRREAKRLATIRSEHVVRVFDYGELLDGTHYLVMERLFGEDLRALLDREGCLPVRRAVKLILDVCRGLLVVHGAGLVHRDLKPANLFVERQADGEERCKILDFGVAKTRASDLTHPGSFVGTIRYMAPEQLEDASAVTASADVYSLGAILFEALAGVPAHGGDTPSEIMFDILHRDPPLVPDRAAVPPELQAIVRRALAHDPNARFASVEDLAQSLARFGPVPSQERHAAVAADVTVSDSSVSILTARAGRRKRWMVVCILALGFIGGWLTRGHEPTTSRRNFTLQGATQPRQQPRATLAPIVLGRTTTSSPPLPASSRNCQPSTRVTAPESGSSSSASMSVTSSSPRGSTVRRYKLRNGKSAPGIAPISKPVSRSRRPRRG